MMNLLLKWALSAAALFVVAYRDIHAGGEAEVWLLRFAVFTGSTADRKGGFEGGQGRGEFARAGGLS